MREFYEETGLQITQESIDITTEYTEQYHCISHGKEVDKTVIYYKAIIPYTDVTKLSGYSE
jgi:8-oxo-dGTP pyrophosphatase MutT (NUDIX family)